MIAGIGIDVAGIERIGKLRAGRGDKFLERVYTPAELKHCLGRANSEDSLAARFAAKEAAMKALGTGFSEGLGWHDVETLPGENGRPEIHFHGRAAARAAELGVVRVLVSLTHDAGVAAAVVVLEA